MIGQNLVSLRLIPTSAMTTGTTNWATAFTGSSSSLSGLSRTNPSPGSGITSRRPRWLR